MCSNSPQSGLRYSAGSTGRPVWEPSFLSNGSNRALMATAARITVVEAEEIVPAGV